MKEYIKPEMEITELNVSEILITGSADGDTIFGKSGTTDEWGDGLEPESKDRNNWGGLLW